MTLASPSGSANGTPSPAPAPVPAPSPDPPTVLPFTQEEVKALLKELEEEDTNPEQTNAIGPIAIFEAFMFLLAAQNLHTAADPGGHRVRPTLRLLQNGPDVPVLHFPWLEPTTVEGAAARIAFVCVLQSKEYEDLIFHPARPHGQVHDWEAIVQHLTTVSVSNDAENQAAMVDAERGIRLPAHGPQDLSHVDALDLACRVYMCLSANLRLIDDGILIIHKLVRPIDDNIKPGCPVVMLSAGELESWAHRRALHADLVLRVRRLYNSAVNCRLLIANRMRAANPKANTSLTG